MCSGGNKKHSKNKTLGSVLAVKVSIQQLNAKARTQTQTSQCGICGAQSGNAGKFLSMYLGFHLSIRFRQSSIDTTQSQQFAFWQVGFTLFIGHEGLQREQRYSSTLFLDLGTRMGDGSASRPGRFLTPGKTRYPLYRRLGGPQGRSGRRKISLHRAPIPGPSSPQSVTIPTELPGPIASWVKTLNPRQALIPECKVLTEFTTTLAMRRSVEFCKEVGEDRSKMETQDETE